MTECILQTCPECRGKIVLNRGLYVCEKCGLVADTQYVPQDYIISLRTDRKELSKQYVSPGNRIDIIDGIGSFIGNFKEKNIQLSDTPLFSRAPCLSVCFFCKFLPQ